ncbi:MAG: hypothetical protein ACD_75C02408G0001 [uncultured bacterium]|nr:MAG: hypothetical protein ACD_75C02408G0001 [uncultured bacterium]
MGTEKSDVKYAENQAAEEGIAIGNISVTVEKITCQSEERKKHGRRQDSHPRR